MQTVAFTLLCLFLPWLARAQDDHTARNVALLAQYYEYGKAREHVKQIAMWAPKPSNLGQPSDAIALRLAVEDIYRTFPDYLSKPLETRAVGDTVVQLSCMSGTHRGQSRTFIFGGLLYGAPATGKRFEVLVTHWWRFDETGKIVWHQVTRDDLGMYQQLGLVKESTSGVKVVAPNGETKPCGN